MVSKLGLGLNSCWGDMNKQEKGSRKEGLNVDQKVVIVAVKASKEIPRDTLVWALTHVAQPGVCIKLLVVIPDESSSNLSSYNCMQFMHIHIFAYVGVNCSCDFDERYHFGMPVNLDSYYTMLSSL